VQCETQQEVDEFWEKLSKEGKTEQCGWLRDTCGLSWQVISAVLGKTLSDPDLAKSQRVMQAMLQMTKIEIAALTKTYEGQ
jgi:predicted 3-demethylubiquinone-9 3-methyltransferase (glyoxalase superfamily)